MSRTLDEIRRDACYNSEAQAMSKPLLTGEKCYCTNEGGCFKFRSSDFGRSSLKSPEIQKKNIWPKCANCGECHPSPTDDLLNKDIIEKAKKSEKKTVWEPTNKTAGCQWPKPCSADCFEDHGSNMKPKAEKGDSCIDMPCADLKKTSYSAFPGI